MNEHGVLRRIAWRDLFPWLILLRTFRLAISPTLLALATAASILTHIGWRLAAVVFIPRQEDRSFFEPRPVPIPSEANSQLRDEFPLAAQEYLSDAPDAFFDGYFELAEPLKRLFQVDSGLTLGETAYFACGALVTLVLWAFVGGVITRRAVVELGAEEPLGIVPAAKFAGRRYLWYLLAPLYPLLGIAILAIPVVLLGLPMRLAEGFGAVLAGLVWIFVVVLGVGAMWLLGGLIFGWPLMWPAVSAERDGDPFEAFSRSFSYVYGRPLHYFFYVVIAALFGALGAAAVATAATLVEEFGFWALSWGGGSVNAARLRELSQIVAGGGAIDLPAEQQALEFGATLIGLVLRLLRAVAFAFNYTYFWCASSAIYLLLRSDVDHQEMDEVLAEDDPRTAPAASTSQPPTAPPAANPPAATEQVERQADEVSDIRGDESAAT